jgi:Putative serine esterase (DUF676)
MEWRTFSFSNRAELFVRCGWWPFPSHLYPPVDSILSIMMIAFAFLALYWFRHLPLLKPFVQKDFNRSPKPVGTSSTQAVIPSNRTGTMDVAMMSTSMKRRQRRKRQKSFTASEGMDVENLESSASMTAASSIISSTIPSALPPMIKSIMLPFSSSLSASAITQLWEDVFLSPESVVPSPFRILKPEEEEALFFTSSDVTRSNQDASNCSDSFLSSSSAALNLQGETSSTTIQMVTSTVHFCFLVHGHRGHSRDLSYVQAVMRRCASLQETSSSQRCIVHSVRCNEKKTDDGVIAGGKRLMEEMLQVIRDTCPRTEPESTMQKVTISLWGNSLGGLYARYALSLLSEMCTVKSASPNYWIMDNTYEIYLNVFCTTATPHLGISGHTFVALPRRAEIGIASAMGETGRDLFRLNTILYDMATQSSYVQPLSLFQKRICYANAYGTDFPVPASTAAFLSEHSTVPHYFADDDDVTIDDTSLVQIATLYTTPALNTGDVDATMATHTDATIASSDIELAQMSISLDSLGWKKVFVDMRKEVPHIVLPKSLIRRSSSNMAANANVKTTDTKTNVTTTALSISSSTESERSTSDEEDDVLMSDQSKIASKAKSRPFIEPIHRLKKRFSKSSPDSGSLILSSKDVAAAVSSSALLVTPATAMSNEGESRSMSSIRSEEEDENNYATIHWPLGHNMIVAFSRSRWSAHMNKAGRPIVDGLAKEMVNDIFAFDTTNQQFCDK